jgi:hypothetical protein
MFGSKSRRIKRLETVMAEEGQFLETARVISEQVKLLEHRDPSEYDSLLDSAFADAAKHAALRLELQKRPAEHLSETAHDNDLAEPDNALGDLELRRVAAVGQFFTGACVSLMGAVFGVMEGSSLPTPHHDPRLSRLAADGALSLISGYVAHRGLKKVESLTAQIIQLEVPASSNDFERAAATS